MFSAIFMGFFCVYRSWDMYLLKVKMISLLDVLVIQCGCCCCCCCCCLLACVVTSHARIYYEKVMCLIFISHILKYNIVVIS